MLFGTQKKALCLLYEIYHRVDHPTNKYLKYLVAVCNARVSAALGELTLVIPCCRTDQFSRSFLSAADSQWNVLSSDVFSGGTLGSFKSAVNSCLLKV